MTRYEKKMRKKPPVVDPSLMTVSIDWQCQDQIPYFLVQLFRNQQVHELHQ